MKESEFVDKNKNKWFEYETLLGNADADPEKLSEVFIQITDDLSYARTNYPNRSVRVYLNNLARRFHDLLGKRKRLILSTLRTFYSIEVPQLFYKARYEMLISAVLFILSFIIGVYSSIVDPNFAELILGEAYVSITNANINNDDPMAIYRTGKGLDSFTSILINNARIDILMLSLGVFFGIGAILVLVYNGIMVGVFQYYFYAHGGFEESLATIWMHGTIEITTIILIGGLALTAGKGWLFPGTYTRFQSFQISAGNAAKLTMAVLPFTFIAALIEGYLTRMTHAEIGFKIFIISISLLVVIFYFIVYPIIIHRKYGVNDNHSNLKAKENNKAFDLFEIKPIFKVVTDSFLVFRKCFFKTILVSLISSALIVATVFLFFEDYLGLIGSDSTALRILEFFNFGQRDIFAQSGVRSRELISFPVVAILAVATAITWAILLKMNKLAFGFNLRSASNKTLVLPFFVLLIAAFFNIYPSKAGVAFSFSVFSNLSLSLAVFFLIQQIEKKRRKINILFLINNIRSFFRLWVILFFLKLFVQVLVNSQLISLLGSSFMELLPFNNIMMQQASSIFSIFGELFYNFSFVGLEFVTTIVLIYSLIERNLATELKEDLESFNLLPITDA